MIQQILPHKAPFLYVDEVLNLTEQESVTTQYHIPVDLPVFSGHFPSEPVFPGVLLAECLAQTADILLLSIPENQNKIPMLFQIEQMRFLSPAKPDDTLTLNAQILLKTDNGMYQCKVRAHCGDKLIATGIITLCLK